MYFASFFRRNRRYRSPHVGFCYRQVAILLRFLGIAIVVSPLPYYVEHLRPIPEPLTFTNTPYFVNLDPIYLGFRKTSFRLN
jgi:hypothetical protein